MLIILIIINMDLLYLIETKCIERKRISVKVIKSIVDGWSI